MKGFWNQPLGNRRKITLEALEERIVFDAAVDPVPQEGPFVVRDLSPLAHHRESIFLGIRPELYTGPVTHAGVSSGTVWDEPQPDPAPQDVTGDLEQAAETASLAAEPDPDAVLVLGPTEDLANMTQTGVTESLIGEQDVIIALGPADGTQDTGAHTGTEGAVNDEGLNVVLIADNFEDTSGMAAAVGPETKVGYIDGRNDDIEAVNERLKAIVDESGQKIGALAIAAHGEPNELAIGAQTLTLNNAIEHKPELEALAATMVPGAQIQLYSCSLAADNDGKALVSAIGEITGAVVFASTDVTGAAPHNWDLEYASKEGIPLTPLFDPGELEQVTGHFAQTPPSIVALSEPRFEAFEMNFALSEPSAPVNTAIFTLVDAGESANSPGAAAGDLGAVVATMVSAFEGINPGTVRTITVTTSGGLQDYLGTSTVTMTHFGGLPAGYRAIATPA